MRAPVAIAVSIISRLGSLSHASTLIVSYSVRMRSAYPPLLPNLHAGRRIAAPPANSPLFRLNAGHDPSQVVHHVPGLTRCKEPLLNLIRIDLAQTPVAPLRNDSLVNMDHVLLPRRLGEHIVPGNFGFDVRRRVLLDHLAERGTNPSAIFFAPAAAIPRDANR